MKSPLHALPPVPRPARALSGLLGGIGILMAWRVAWVFLAWHWSGLHPNLESFVAHRQEFMDWELSAPFRTWIYFLLAYTLVCALCLDGTATLVVIAGALFGPWKGLALCTVGSSLGATMAFTFSRRFLGGWMHKNFFSTLETVNRGLKQDGDAWLLTARLVPMVSFSFVNLIVGLSGMRTRRFFVLTTLGLLPCNAAYAWAGVHLGKLHAAHELLSPRLVLSLCAVGLMPLALHFGLRFAGVLKRH